LITFDLVLQFEDIETLCFFVEVLFNFSFCLFLVLVLPNLFLKIERENEKDGDEGIEKEKFE